MALPNVADGMTVSMALTAEGHSGQPVGHSKSTTRPPSSPPAGRFLGWQLLQSNSFLPAKRSKEREPGIHMQRRMRAHANEGSGFQTQGRDDLAWKGPHLSS